MIHNYNYSEIRKLVEAAFSDEDLQIFCSDYFPDVAEQFTTGQTKRDRVQKLIDYIRRRGLTDKLLDGIREANIYQYERFDVNLKEPEEIEIPFVVAAMNKDDAAALQGETVLNDEELSPAACKRIGDYLKILSTDDLTDLLNNYGELQEYWKPHKYSQYSFYGEYPEDWKPHRYSQSSIKQIIWDILNCYNLEQGCSQQTAILPDFISAEFFSDNKQLYKKARKRLKQSGGVLVIDAVSLLHPKLFHRIAGCGLISEPKMAVIILSPVSQNTLESNMLIENIICSGMNQAFHRFKDDCDPLFSIGVSDLRIFKRWLLTSLHVAAERKKKMNRDNQGKFQGEIPFEPTNIHNYWTP